ncbi:hypothetical protein [Psychrobacillus phage Perkons]|nr:hypothetical protein [Psychrobacillus phage Perkons]
MIKSFNDGKLVSNQKVLVYRNLNNGLFSIKDMKSSLVVAHGNEFVVVKANPYVSEIGRKRVLTEKQPNLHASIIGTYIDNVSKDDYTIVDEAYYNPYTTDKFISKSNGEVIKEGDFLFDNGKAYLIEIIYN